VLAKPIFDITPFTMLDFPSHLACIVWFAGCNMRCSYCYNPHIVLQKGTKTIDELLAFLRTRIGRLEGVVLSGGECTLYANLAELCTQIKKLGFKVKIDTNGSNPKVLKSLLEQSLADFISLDFKAPKPLFHKITLSNFYDKTIESLRILVESGADFEVRTTIHPDLLSENDINDIIAVLAENHYKGNYFLQNYLHTEHTLGNTAEPSKRLDKNLLSNKIRAEFRNF
jgi:pyruvate formate lyase activating enzyme